MTRDDITRMAREAGFGGEVWSYEDAFTKFAALVAAAEREKVAKWMIERGYATGHGDTIEDLLVELDWQIADGWNRALMNGVETEREQCAKVLDEMAAKDKLTNYYKVAALAIRKRGAP